MNNCLLKEMKERRAGTARSTNGIGRARCPHRAVWPVCVHKTSSKHTNAFSLIEVTIALGVIAIGLIAILGLLPQGLSSARNASDDTLGAMIVQDTIAARRIELQTGASTIGAINIPPRWFRPDGVETDSTASVSAMYKCELSTTKITNSLEEARVTVVWPWYDIDTSTKSPPNTNIFMTRITVY